MVFLGYDLSRQCVTHYFSVCRSILSKTDQCKAIEWMQQNMVKRHSRRQLLTNRNGILPAQIPTGMPFRCIAAHLHPWLGSSKSIWPVNLSDEVLVWLSVWSEVLRICIWSSWCYCHLISCFIKIHNGLPFWCLFTQVVLERRPLSGYNSLLFFTHVDSFNILNLKVETGNVPKHI